MQATSLSLRRLAAALALALCGGIASAAGTMTVSIDTSTFGSDGWLDLQFNPSGIDAGAYASATLTNFHGFDATADVQIAGDVSGSLASGYVLGNTTSWNDLFHSVQYGQVLRFDVTFSGDADPTLDPQQSVFSVSAYAADQVTVLGSPSSAFGELVSFAWTPATVAGAEGSVASSVYSDFATVSAVPEPSSWLMLGIGGLLVAGAVRRRAA